MKKIFAFGLCFALLMSLSAFAAAEIDKKGFVFREGIRWGMSAEKVVDITEESVNTAPYGNTEVLRVTFPSVSDFRADMLYYLFENDSLYAAFYTFEVENPSLYLKRALNSLYGEIKKDSEALSDFASILSELPSLAVNTDELVSHGQWKTEDGTDILLASAGDVLLLAYYNLDYWAPELNTEGL